MKDHSISAGGMNLTVIVMGILAALPIFVVLTGKRVLLLTSNRAALLALAAVGIILCAQVGVGRVAASRQWLHPFSLIGYLLGAAILPIGFAALSGKNITPLTDIRQSFIAIAVIAAVKLVLMTKHRLLT